ncbi:hypothetical protein JXB31_04990 [Candidatus Woesearchaeota archaeon]|nr:hypothetical protein [Candidatus Woesearchaeota archaeon]
MNKVVAYLVVFALVASFAYGGGEEDVDKINVLANIGIIVENANNIITEIGATNQITLGLGSHAEITSSFTGTIKGGHNGGSLLINNKLIPLTEGSTIEIRNGAIKTIENLQTKETIDINGQQVSGSILSYDGMDLKTDGTVIINGDTYSTLEGSVIYVIKKEELSIFSNGPSTMTVNGKRVVIKNSGSIKFQKGKLTAFNQITILDPIEFNGWNIAGQELSSNNYDENEEIQFKGSFQINDKKFLSGGNIDVNLGVDDFKIGSYNYDIRQIGDEGTVMREISGICRFYRDDEHRFTLLSEYSDFKEFTLGAKMLTISKYKGKEVDFYIGDTTKNEHCSKSSSDNCIEITKEKILKGHLNGNTELEFTSRRDDSFTKGEANLPISMVDLEQIKDNSKLIISNKHGELIIDKNGLSLTDPDEWSFMRGIVIHGDKGTEAFDNKGVKINNKDIATFVDTIIDEAIAEHGMYGKLTQNQYNNVKNFIGSLETYNGEPLNQDTKDYLVSLLTHQMYRDLLKEENDYKSNTKELAKILDRLAKTDVKEYETIKDYITSQYCYSLFDNKIRPYDIATLTKLYEMAPEYELKEDVFLNIEPGSIEALNDNYALLGLDDKENFKKFTNIMAGHSSYDIEELANIFNLVKENDYLGMDKTPDSIYALYYGFLGDPSDVRKMDYSFDDLNAMYDFHRTFNTKIKADYLGRSPLALNFFFNKLKEGKTEDIEILNKLTNNYMDFDYFMFKGSEPHFKTRAGLLSLDKSQKYEYDEQGIKDLSKAVELIESMTDKSSVIDKKDLQDFLIRQGNNIVSPLNGFHNEKDLRLEYLQKIPSNMLPYAIAAGFNNMGTENGESYPSSQDLLIDEFIRRAEYRKESAESLMDLDMHSELVFALAEKQRLYEYLKETDKETQDAYIKYIVSEFNQNNIFKDDYQKIKDVIYHSFGKIISSTDPELQESRNKLKEEIMNSGKKEGVIKNLQLQFLILQNMDSFTEEELLRVDPTYKDGHFNKFDQKVYKAKRITEKTDISKMIVKENGQSRIKGAVWFGSLDDSNEHWTYGALVSRMEGMGFKKTDEQAETQSVKHNGQTYEFKTLELKKKITYKDDDGATKTEDVVFEFKIYPRGVEPSDPLTTFNFGRGHVNAVRLGNNIDENNIDSETPIYLNYGGCYCIDSAKEVIRQNSQATILASATPGTGDGVLNNAILQEQIEGIIKGKTGIELENHIKQNVLERLCGECTTNDIAKLQNSKDKTDQQNYKMYTRFVRYNFYSDLAFASLAS